MEQTSNDLMSLSANWNTCASSEIPLSFWMIFSCFFIHLVIFDGNSECRVTCCMGNLGRDPLGLPDGSGVKNLPAMQETQEIQV